MSSGIDIRFGQLSDLQAILALAHSVQETPHWTNGHYAELLTTTVAGTPRRALLLAKKYTELIGFCIVSVARDESELENIVVTSEFRRLGVGRKLLREGLVWAEAAGAKQVWLEVRESNAGALSLYQSLGFEATGRRKAYYRDPLEDAVIMRAALTHATHLQ